MSGNSQLALYVHLPWCVRKCPYCDFNSHQLKTAQPDSAYIDALLQDFELDRPLVAERRIYSVFFGGGTPSLFAPEDFARLLQALRQRIAFTNDAEITLEANPGTIERGRFAGYAQAGINRVSLGAQTFAPQTLKLLGRIHTPQDTLRAVDELRAAGLHNFNIDLMYALPQQGIDAALADIKIVCELQPAHISYYQLTLEPGTVFHARPPVLPDEELAWQIQTESQRLLAAAGYEQYEISAYAKSGARCRHNLNYWLFGDYLGLGAGAHGKLTHHLPQGIMRTTKPKQPREYQARVEERAAQAGSRAQAERPAQVVGERRYIPPKELPFEFMLNALRLNEGFATRDFETRTGLPAIAIQPTVERAVARGLMEAGEAGWRATSLGLRFLNDLQMSFLE